MASTSGLMLASVERTSHGVPNSVLVDRPEARHRQSLRAIEPHLEAVSKDIQAPGTQKDYDETKRAPFCSRAARRPEGNGRRTVLPAPKASTGRNCPSVKGFGASHHSPGRSACCVDGTL